MQYYAMLRNKDMFGNVHSQLEIHPSKDSITLGGRVEPAIPLRYGKNDRNIKVDVE